MVENFTNIWLSVTFKMKIYIKNKQNALQLSTLPSGTTPSLRKGNCLLQKMIKKKSHMKDEASN